jgi:hypothetical protein
VSGNREVTYALDFCSGRKGRATLMPSSSSSNWQSPDSEAAGGAIPRIARLLALAIRFEGLVRDQTIRDYAELARLGRVTRARMTQIMKLLDLAPDIQEQILFLPPVSLQNGTGLTERNLRPVVSRIDWRELGLRDPFRFRFLGKNAESVVIPHPSETEATYER